jgi:mannose-1-phosphate guanylyltransferase
MINILLCGGSGSRLWPVSREHYPKQFSNLIDERSLFQDTLLRNAVFCKKIIVVTNIEQYPLAKIQTETLNLNNVEFILEPVGRNTAPAIAIACMNVSNDDTVLITPSDHYIQDEDKYKNVLDRAKALAENNYLVTFGIKPTAPETGFGYIESEGETVISFHEKPNEETARKYLEAGNYYWNSGMFAFKARIFLEELRNYANDIYTTSQGAFNNREVDGNTAKILRSFIEKIPSNSIDYAVMEKSTKIKMIPTDMHWSDIGSFEAIYEASTQDENGNVSVSENIFYNSKNNLVISGKRLITLIDADDLVVVDTSDALLISKKGSSHKIKEVLQKIREIAPDLLKNHTGPNKEKQC